MMRGAFGFPVVVACLALLLTLLMTGRPAVASPTVAVQPATMLAVDSDGDGIPDDMDPDDNNDGTSDDGTTNGPIPDGDNDGIPNDLDPDDNNNGVTDENETGSSPVSGGNSGGTGGEGGSAGGTMIRALPATGAGMLTSTGLAPGYGMVAGLLLVAAVCHQAVARAAGTRSSRD